jgi:hypothetical protein
MPSPYKISREPWDKSIQHLPSVKAKTEQAKRKFRRLEKEAIRKGEEPITKITAGDRY